MRQDCVLDVALCSAVSFHITEPLWELVPEVLVKQQNPLCVVLSGPGYEQLPMDALQGLQKMHIFLKQILPSTTHPSLAEEIPKISCQNKQVGT